MKLKQSIISSNDKVKKPPQMAGTFNKYKVIP